MKKSRCKYGIEQFLKSAQVFPEGYIKNLIAFINNNFKVVKQLILGDILTILKYYIKNSHKNTDKMFLFSHYSTAIAMANVLRSYIL